MKFLINFLGRVSGWGLSESGGKPSETLRSVELPAITRAECLIESKVLFRPNVTVDKFCAGYLNSNKGVCDGEFVTVQEKGIVLIENVCF